MVVSQVGRAHGHPSIELRRPRRGGGEGDCDCSGEGDGDADRKSLCIAYQSSPGVHGVVMVILMMLMIVMMVMFMVVVIVMRIILMIMICARPAASYTAISAPGPDDPQECLVENAPINKPTPAKK
jgi:hypothetical protein